MQSKYNGKCKDCGKPHKIGDEINKNNNDVWCRDGKSCQGAMQLQGNPNTSDANIIHAPVPTPQFNSEPDLSTITQAFLAQLGGDVKDTALNAIKEGNRNGEFAVAFYIGVRQVCESAGISNPQAIGMIYKEAMGRVNA